MMSQKLYSEAKSALAEAGKPSYSTLETPWVVLQKNKLYLDQPVPLFTFHHPNRGSLFHDFFLDFNHFLQIRLLTIPAMELSHSLFHGIVLYTGSLDFSMLRCTNGTFSASCLKLFPRECLAGFLFISLLL